VRDVDQIAFQTADDGAKREKTFERIVALVKLNAMKVRRQGLAFGDFLWRADKKILCLLIQPTQGPDHVSDIGAHAEFRHATDVDGHFHGLNLITGRARADREFRGYQQ
jgi:hypothetical protein